MTKAETENDVVEVGHMRLTVLACAHAEAAAKYRHLQRSCWS